MRKTPAGITLTTVLMAIAVILHLVAATASALPARWSASHGLIAYSAASLGAVAAGLLVVFVEYLVLWFYWHGRNWSRWLVLVGCLLCFVSLRHFVIGPPVSHARTLIIFYRIAVAIGVMSYLCTHEARAWFARGDLRVRPS